MFWRRIFADGSGVKAANYLKAVGRFKVNCDESLRDSEGRPLMEALAKLFPLCDFGADLRQRGITLLGSGVATLTAEPPPSSADQKGSDENVLEHLLRWLKLILAREAWARC